MTTSNELD